MTTVDGRMRVRGPSSSPEAGWAAGTTVAHPEHPHTLEAAVNDDRESFADRFVDVALDKGTLWLLLGAVVLAAVVAGGQIGIAL